MTLGMAVSAHVERVLEMCDCACFPKVEGSIATALCSQFPGSGVPAA